MLPTTPQPPTIFCDLDGVIIDLMPGWLARYNRDHGDTLTVDQITAWDMKQFVKPEAYQAIYNYLHAHELYDDAPPMPGALEGVQALRDLGYRVAFATSANMHMAGRKLRWLADHGFLSLQYGTISPDYIEITDKSLLHGLALIDDYPKNLANFCGQRVLFPAPHNAAAEVAGLRPLVRPTDWPAVVAFFASHVCRGTAASKSTVANGLW